MSNQTQAVAQAAKPFSAQVKDALNNANYRKMIEDSLGENAGTFLTSVITLCSNDKALQTCKVGDIAREAARAACMRLPISKELGQAYVVVYKNNIKDDRGNIIQVVPTPTFIVGYRGLIQLAKRSGNCRYINADVVRDGEILRHDKKSGEPIFADTPNPNGKVIGYFAYLEETNGFSKTVYITLEEMAKYAKRFSKSIGKGVTVEMLMEKANQPALSGVVGWMGDFNAMAKKTCLRRLLGTYATLSIELQTALENESRMETADEQRDHITAGANAQIVDADAIEVEPLPIAETAGTIQPQNAPIEEPGY